MSWYWLDHTLIPQRAIYLFLTQQLPLIDDVNNLIHNNVKQLLSPWSKSDNDTELDRQYDKSKKHTSLGSLMKYPCQFHKNGRYTFIDFRNMTMSFPISDITWCVYKLMRIETNKL